MTIIFNDLEIEKPQTSLPPQTLADLAEFIADLPSLPGSAKADKLSAIHSFAKYIGRPMSSLPADMRALHHQVSQLHHDRLGVSKKRLQNVISGLKTSLELCHTQFPGMRRRGFIFSDRWSELINAIPSGSKIRIDLSRFLWFCDINKTAPCDVNDQSLARFYEQDLLPYSTQKNPHKKLPFIARAWNKASVDIDGWPSQKLKVPSFKKQTGQFSKADLPASFHADIKQFIEATQRADILSDDEAGALEPVKQITAESYASELVRAAISLLADGMAAEEIEALNVFGEPDVCKRALICACSAEKKFTKKALRLSKILVSLNIRYLQSSPAVINKLKGHASKIAKAFPAGMTKKNQDRLLQFSSEDEQRALLCAADCLALAVQSRLRKGLKLRKQDANDLAIAASLSILMVAPMRRKNLLGLRFDKHLDLPSREKPWCDIRLEASEVKNEAALSYKVPDNIWAVVDFYIQKGRNLLMEPTSDYLFPFIERGEHGARYFSTLFSQRIKTVSGFDMNPHLMRHAVAKLFLEQNPGQYETVRLTLGHKSIRTTTDFYCGTEKDQAIAHFDKEILKIREA